MTTWRKFEEIETRQMCRDYNVTLKKWISDNRFERDYPLINQMTRSAGSMMDNIAEGFERGSTSEFVSFLGYSKGSAGEQRSQLHRAKDWGYIDNVAYIEALDKLEAISSKLNKMISYLNSVKHRGNRFR